MPMALSARPGAAQAPLRLHGTKRFTTLPLIGPRCMKKGTETQANSVDGPTWPQPLEHVALATFIASCTATDEGMETISLSTLAFAEGLLWVCADQAPNPSTPRSVHGWFREDNVKGLMSHLAKGAAGAAVAGSGGNGKPRGPYARGSGGSNGGQGPRYPPFGGQNWEPPDPRSYLALLCALLLVAVQRLASALAHSCSNGIHSAAAAAAAAAGATASSTGPAATAAPYSPSPATAWAQQQAQAFGSRAGGLRGGRAGLVLHGAVSTRHVSQSATHSAARDSTRLHRCLRALDGMVEGPGAGAGGLPTQELPQVQAGVGTDMPSAPSSGARKVMSGMGLGLGPAAVAGSRRQGASGSGARLLQERGAPSPAGAGLPSRASCAVEAGQEAEVTAAGAPGNTLPGLQLSRTELWAPPGERQGREEEQEQQHGQVQQPHPPRPYHPSCALLETARPVCSERHRAEALGPAACALAAPTATATPCPRPAYGSGGPSEALSTANPPGAWGLPGTLSRPRPLLELTQTLQLGTAAEHAALLAAAPLATPLPSLFPPGASAAPCQCPSFSPTPPSSATPAVTPIDAFSATLPLPSPVMTSISPASCASACSNMHTPLLPLEPAHPINTRRSLDGLSAALQVRAAASAALPHCSDMIGPAPRRLHTFRSHRHLPTTHSGTPDTTSRTSSGTYWASLLCSAQDCAALAQQHAQGEAVAHTTGGQDGCGTEEEDRLVQGVVELPAASCYRASSVASGLAPDHDEEPDSRHQQQGQGERGAAERGKREATGAQAGASRAGEGAAAARMGATGWPSVDPRVGRPGPASIVHDAPAPGQQAVRGGNLETGPWGSTYTTAFAYLRAFASSISTSSRALTASHQTQLQGQGAHVSAQRQPRQQQQQQPKEEQKELRQGPATPSSASRNRPYERASSCTSYTGRTHDQAAPPPPPLLSYFSHSSHHMQHALRAPSLSASTLPLTQSRGHADEASSASGGATGFAQADPRTLPDSTAGGRGAGGNDDVCGSAGKAGPAGLGSTSLRYPHAPVHGARAAEGRGAEATAEAEAAGVGAAADTQRAADGSGAEVLEEAEAPGVREAAGVRVAADTQAGAKALCQQQGSSTREVPLTPAGAFAVEWEVGSVLEEVAAVAAAAEAAADVAWQQSRPSLVEAAAGAATGARGETETVFEPRPADADAVGAGAAAQRMGSLLVTQGVPATAITPYAEPISASCAPTKPPVGTLAGGLAAGGLEEEPGSCRLAALCDAGQPDKAMPLLAAESLRALGADAYTPAAADADAGGQDVAAVQASAAAVNSAVVEEVTAVPPPAIAVATAAAAQQRPVGVSAAPQVAAAVSETTADSEEEEAMAALVAVEGGAGATVLPGSGTEDLETAAALDAAALLQRPSAPDVAEGPAEAVVGAAAAPEAAALSATLAASEAAAAAGAAEALGAAAALAEAVVGAEAAPEVAAALGLAAAPEATATPEAAAVPEAADAAVEPTAPEAAAGLEDTGASTAQAAAAAAAAAAAGAQVTGVVQAGTTPVVETDGGAGPEAQPEAPEGTKPSAPAELPTVAADDELPLVGAGDEPSAGFGAGAEAVAAAIAPAVSGARGGPAAQVPPGSWTQAPDEAVVEAQAVCGLGCPAAAVAAPATEGVRGDGRGGLRLTAGQCSGSCAAAAGQEADNAGPGRVQGPGGSWALSGEEEGGAGHVVSMHGERGPGLQDPQPGRWRGEEEGEQEEEGEAACRTCVGADEEDAAAAPASSVSLAATCGSPREPRAGGTCEGSRIPHSPDAGGSGMGKLRGVGRIPLPPASGWRTVGPQQEQQQQEDNGAHKLGAEAAVLLGGTKSVAERLTGVAEPRRPRAGGSSALPGPASPRRASYGERSPLRRGALEAHAVSLPRLNLRAVNGDESSGPPSPAHSTRSTASARSTLSLRSTISTSSRPGSSLAAPAAPRSAFGRTIPQLHTPPAAPRTLSGSAASSPASARPHAGAQHNEVQPHRAFLNSTLTSSPRPAQHSSTAASTLASTPTSPCGSTLDSSRRSSSFTASTRGAASAGPAGLATRVRSALGPSLRAEATAHQQKPLSRLASKSPSVAFGRSIVPHTAGSLRSPAAASKPAGLRDSGSCDTMQHLPRGSRGLEAAPVQLLSTLPLQDASSPYLHTRAPVAPSFGPPVRAAEGVPDSSSHSRSRSGCRSSLASCTGSSSGARPLADGSRVPHAVLYTSVTPVPDGDPFDSPLLLPVPQIVTAGDATAADLMAVAAAAAGAAAMPASLSTAAAAATTAATAAAADTDDEEEGAGVRSRSLRWGAAAAAGQGGGTEVQAAAGSAPDREPAAEESVPAAERPAGLVPHVASVAVGWSPGHRPTGRQPLLQQLRSGHSSCSVLPHMDLREDAFSQGPTLDRAHSATGMRTEHAVSSPSRLAGSASGAGMTRLRGLQGLGGDAAGALGGPRVPVGQRNRRRHSVAAYTAAGTAAAAAVTRELTEATRRRRCSTALGFVAADASTADAANTGPAAIAAPGSLCAIDGVVGDGGGELVSGEGLQAGGAIAGQQLLLDQPQGRTGADCKMAAERWCQQGKVLDSQQKQQRKQHWPGPGAPTGTGMAFGFTASEGQMQGQGQGQRRGHPWDAMGSGDWSNGEEPTVAGHAAASVNGATAAAAAAAATPLPSPAGNRLPWPRASRGGGGGGGGGGVRAIWTSGGDTDGGPGVPDGRLTRRRRGANGQANGVGDSDGPSSSNSGSSSSGDEGAFIRGASEPACRTHRPQLPAGDAAMHAGRGEGRHKPDAPGPGSNGTGTGSATGSTGGCSGGGGSFAAELLPASHHTWFGPGIFRSCSRVFPRDAPTSSGSSPAWSGGPASPRELQQQLSGTPGTPSRQSSGLFARVSRTFSKRVMPLPPPVPVAHSSLSLHRVHSATAAAGVSYDAAAAAAAAAAFGPSTGSPRGRHYRRAASSVQVAPAPAQNGLYGGAERPVGLSPGHSPRMPYSRAVSTDQVPTDNSSCSPSPVLQQHLERLDGAGRVASSPRAQRPSRRSVSRSSSPSQAGACRGGEVAGAAAPHERQVGLAAASTLRHVSPLGRKHAGGAHGGEEDGEQEQERVALALLQQLPPGSPAAAWLAGRRLAQRPGHHRQGLEYCHEGGSGGGGSGQAAVEPSVTAPGSDLAEGKSPPCQEASATSFISSPGAARGAAAAGPPVPTPFLGIGQRLLGLRRPETRPQQLPYASPLLATTSSQGPHSSPNMDRGLRPSSSLLLPRSPGSRLQAAPTERGDPQPSPREASWSPVAERAALLGVQGLRTGCGGFGRPGLGRAEAGEGPGEDGLTDIKPVSAGGHEQGSGAGGTASGLLRMASARALCRTQSGGGSRRMHPPEWQQVYDTPEGVLRPRYSQRHMEVLQASPLASPVAWSPRTLPATAAAPAQVLEQQPVEVSNASKSDKSDRAFGGAAEGVQGEQGHTGSSRVGPDCSHTSSASSTLGCADLCAGSTSARVWHTRATRLQLLLHGQVHGQHHSRGQLVQADSDGQAHSGPGHLRRCEVLAARGMVAEGGSAWHSEEVPSTEARTGVVEVGEGGLLDSSQKVGPCGAGQGQGAGPSFSPAVSSPGPSPSAVAAGLGPWAGQVRTPLSRGGGRRAALDPQDHAPGGVQHSSAGDDTNNSGLAGLSRNEAAVDNTDPARGSSQGGSSSHVGCAAVAQDTETASEAGRSAGTSSCAHGQLLVSTAFVGEALGNGSEQGAGGVGAVEKEEVVVGVGSSAGGDPVAGSVAAERASGGGGGGGGEEGAAGIVGAHEQRNKPRRGLFERAVHKVKKVLKGQRSGKG